MAIFGGQQSKYDGRITPFFQDAATAAQALVKYTDVTAFDVQTPHPRHFLVTVQLRAMLASEIPASVVGFLGRTGPQDNLPESPPVAVRVQYGIENEFNLVDVDVGRGAAIPVFGTRVIVRGFGSYTPNASAAWPSALILSAVPDGGTRSYLAPRRTIDYGNLAAASAQTQPVPLLASRAEVTCGSAGGPAPDILLEFLSPSGLVQAVWNYTNAEWLRREQSFPVDPLSNRLRITNNGLNGQPVKVSYTLDL